MPALVAVSCLCVLFGVGCDAIAVIAAIAQLTKWLSIQRRRRVPLDLVNLQFGLAGRKSLCWRVVGLPGAAWMSSRIGPRCGWLVCRPCRCGVRTIRCLTGRG